MNHKGQSLIGVMVAGVIGSIIMVAISKGIQSTYKVERGISSNVELDEIANLFHLITDSPQACALTELIDKDVTVLIPPLPTPIPTPLPVVLVPEISLPAGGGSGGLVLATGSNFAGTRRVEQIALASLTSAGAPGAYIASLTIGTTIVGQAMTSRNPIKTFYLDITVDSANKIRSCGAHSSGGNSFVTQIVCEAMGGTYDIAATPPCLLSKLGVSDSVVDRDAGIASLPTTGNGIYSEGGILSRDRISVLQSRNGDTAEELQILNVSTGLDPTDYPKKSTIRLRSPASPGKHEHGLRLGTIQYDPATGDTADGNWWTIVSSGGNIQFNCDSCTSISPPTSRSIMHLTPNGLYVGDANNGAKTYSMGFVNYSDKRLKENIKTIQSALELVGKLRGVQYTWKRDHYSDSTSKVRELGVIAQEIQKIFPALVEKGQDGYLAVNYNALIGLLIEAVKEQQAQHTAMKAEQNAFKKEVLRLLKERK